MAARSPGAAIAPASPLCRPAVVALRLATLRRPLGPSPMLRASCRDAATPPIARVSLRPVSRSRKASPPVAAACADAARPADAGSAPVGFSARLEDAPRMIDVTRIVASEWRPLAAAVVVAAAAACVNLSTPLVQGRIIQAVSSRADPKIFYRLWLQLACFYCLDPVFTHLYVRLVTGAAESAAVKLRISAFQLLLSQEQTYFDKHSSTELTQLVCTDLDSLRSMVLSNVSRDRGMRAVLETLGALVALAWTAPRVGWLVGGMCLASGAVAFYVRSSAASSAGRASNLRAEAAGCAEETFAGIRVLRAFSGARVALKRWSSIAGSLAQSGRSTGNTRAALETANRGAVHVALLALYGGGSALVYRGDLPLATLMAALGYTYALVFSTQGVLQTIVDVRGQGSVFRDALRTLRDVEAPREPPACKGVGADHVPTAPTEVTFDDVTFAYPGASAPSVRGVSLTLRPGRVTALVGPSGSGKSTLAALLERAYEPSSGRLLVGGCDAACVSRGLWPLVVSPVPQDALLFDGTVEDNISMGAEPARVAAEAAGRTLDTPAAAHAASVAAAEAAGVQLETLDGGMQARVGVRGSRLSGGQRQRVAIARALRSSSPIVVLDEPTSALDAQAEATVAEAVARLAKNGRTVLLVAHRLSTVRAADEIVVLDRGRVVERGTHAQLARKEGLYASLLRASDATAAGTRDMTARA